MVSVATIRRMETNNMVNAEKVARRIAAVGMELQWQIEHDAMPPECVNRMKEAAIDLRKAFDHVEAATAAAQIATVDRNAA